MLKVSVIICLALVSLALGGRVRHSESRFGKGWFMQNRSSRWSPRSKEDFKKEITSRDHELEVIESERVTTWGDWSGFEHCDGSFAVSFRQRVQSDQSSDGDNTALNEIELTCANGNAVRGAEGMWGEWGDEVRCEDGNGFKGFMLKHQEPQGSQLDDSAAVSLAMICTNDQVVFPTNELWWGEWRRPRLCSDGNVICGLRVQIQADQGDEDDTALNNVDFQCCSPEEPTTTTTTTTTPRPRSTTTTTRRTTTTTRRPTTTTTRRPTTTTRRPTTTTTRRPTTTTTRRPTTTTRRPTTTTRRTSTTTRRSRTNNNESPKQLTWKFDGESTERSFVKVSRSRWELIRNGDVFAELWQVSHDRDLNNGNREVVLKYTDNVYVKLTEGSLYSADSVESLDSDQLQPVNYGTWQF